MYVNFQKFALNLVLSVKNSEMNFCKLKIRKSLLSYIFKKVESECW